MGFRESNCKSFGGLTVTKLSQMKDMKNNYLENLSKGEIIINSVSGPNFLDDEMPFSTQMLLEFVGFHGLL